MLWLVKIAFFIWDKKVFAATGLVSSGALVGVFGAAAMYSDKANDDLHAKISMVQNHQYEQILWRLDSVALGQNKQERDIEKLDRRIWELNQSQQTRR